MPSRSQTRIRRDINRLSELLSRQDTNDPALFALKPLVNGASQLANERWQAYQQASVTATKEREERNQALGALTNWLRKWRPLLALMVPGVDSNLRRLPATGTTPDDLIRAAEDLAVFIQRDPGAEHVRSPTLEALGNGIEAARKETEEAAHALPIEAGAREALTEDTETETGETATPPV